MFSVLKLKWILCILPFFILSCKNNITVSEDEISADVLYVNSSYKPYSGKCIVLYKNTDVIKHEFSFKDGVLNGEATSWYKNGKLKRKGNYINGQVSGNWTFWDYNGQKLAESNY